MGSRGARRLREAVQSLGRRRRNDPVPLGLRRRLVVYAQARRRAGGGWGTIGRELGVAGATLQRWCAPARERVRLRPVRVGSSERKRPLRPTQPPMPRVVVVVTAAGHRVEGLGASEAAALLRALAG